MSDFFSKEVENFYSTGIKKKHLKFQDIERIDRGFLNFGLWENGTRNYREAAANLLTMVIDNSGITSDARILDAACGYGTETFEIHTRLKPRFIEGIDITGIHMEFAQRKAHSLGLHEEIRFQRADCCNTNYRDDYFSALVAIEGPAHFYTKADFIKEANRVLENKGKLVLTDIILGKKFNWDKKFQVAVMKFTSKCWKLPRVNWIDEQDYKKLLKDSGFRLDVFNRLGESVFPGYAKNCLKLRTIRTRIFHRGFWAIMGMTFISYLLGYLQKKEMIDYIFVTAEKK